MPEVDYNRESYNRCLCGGCPVNRSSSCTQGKEQELNEYREAIEKEARMPDAAIMPGIYCSTPVGKSSCDDLGNGKVCLCPACPLHFKEVLENSYYCLKGSAVEVG